MELFSDACDFSLEPTSITYPPLTSYQTAKQTWPHTPTLLNHLSFTDSMLFPYTLSLCRGDWLVLQRYSHISCENVLAVSIAPDEKFPKRFVAINKCWCPVLASLCICLFLFPKTASCLLNAFMIPSHIMSYCQLGDVTFLPCSICWMNRVIPIIRTVSF